MMEQKANFRRLKVFPQTADRDVLCFNLGGDNFKLVRGRMTSSGVKLVDFKSVSVQGMSDEEVSKAVKETMDGWKIKASETVSLIPAHFAITKDIEIPSQDHNEIREILDLQAVRHTPYSQEEIIIDYIKIGMRKENYTKLIFMIVPLSLVRRQIAILARAGVKTEHVFFAPEALGLACSQIFQLERKESLCTIIHMDAKFTDFINVFKGQLIYTRSVPIGTQHLEGEAERYRARFVEEIKKSVEAYEGEDNKLVSEEYFLTGASVEEAGLQGALQQALNKPVKITPYWDYLPLASEDLKQILSASKESFLDAAAALMVIDRLNVNFIPQEIRLRKVFEQKSEDLVKIGISVMIVLLLAGTMTAVWIYSKTAYLTGMKDKYRNDLQKAEVLRKDFSRMQAIKDFSAGNAVPLDILDELYRLIPSDIRFVAIKYAGQGKFAVEGNARNMSTVFSFLTRLEESRYFQKAESKRTAKRQEAGEELVDFEIICMLEGASEGGPK